MGPRQGLTIIDTNVFVIDLRYRRDKNFDINREFLENMSKSGLGVTTLTNLLELCGILSFNLNGQQLTELFFHFRRRYKICVVPTPQIKQYFPTVRVEDILKIISLKTGLGDALFIATIKNCLPLATTIVSWDKDHLTGRIDIEVVSPKDFLEMRRG